MRVKQILTLCLMFVLSSAFLFCLFLGNESIVLSSLPTAATGYITRGDTTSTTPTTPSTVTSTSDTTGGGTTVTTSPTTTSGSGSTTIPTVDRTLTTVTDTTTPTTTSPSTTTTPSATSSSGATAPSGTTTGTSNPVDVISGSLTPDSPKISLPTDTTTIVHPVSTTGTTQAAPTATTSVTTSPAAPNPATSTGAGTTITATGTTSAVPATTPSTANTTASTTGSPSGTAASSLTAPQTALAATGEEQDPNAITPAQLDMSSQISGPLTENKKFCLTLEQKVDSFTYKVEGAVNKNLTVFEPRPLTYCANLPVNDFTDGPYKITAEVKLGAQTVFNTLAIVINKAASQSANEQKISELENRCSQAGADSSDECKDFYLDKYSEKIDCQGLNSSDCGTSIKDTYIETIVETQKEYASINAQAEDIFDKNMTAGKLENLVNQSNGEKVLNLSIPLKEKETEIQVLQSYESVILDKDKGLIQTAPIVILIDSDGDGVSDDIEKKLGTKPNVKDTDGDGYSDGDELRNGYDPLGGEGKRDMGLSPIEKALVQGKAIEQAKTSGEESTSLTVVDSKTVYAADGKEDGYIMSGKADANTVITLYIYSDVPIVTTITADEYGNWEYHFTKELESGKHEVYVAINDETGKVVKKSSPLSFFVEEAHAVSSDVPASTTPSEQATDNMIDYYLYAAAGLMFLGVIIFLIALFKSRNKTKNDKAEGNIK